MKGAAKAAPGFRRKAGAPTAGDPDTATFLNGYQLPFPRLKAASAPYPDERKVVKP